MDSFLSALLLLATSAIAQISDPLQYVDQLIGTQAGGTCIIGRSERKQILIWMSTGNVFAGASLPYGMAKAVADTDSQSNQGGFTTDGANITGFSSMHDSGTG